MKNRYCKLSKFLLMAVGLLSTCGITYSCSDDFDLDETKPSYLGQSIYDELKNRTDRKFGYTVRLIDDLGYTESMSKTGSNTLFVADDEAYERFFQDNAWGVKSYDDLTVAQKRLLLKGSMLTNANLIEMLADVSSTNRNSSLRRGSSANVVDSIPLWQISDLYDNPNNPEEADVTKDERFWDHYRQTALGGIYMALDATNPMITYFVDGVMRENQVTHDDLNFVLGNPQGSWPESESRAYVYNRRVVEQDNICENGYYHVLDDVLLTPSNMAEVIRTNGKTNLFSALLERFSAPYYNKTITDEYKALHTIAADSIFEKRYLSQRSKGLVQNTSRPNGTLLTNYALLAYDPGWNQYTTGVLTPKEEDMAAMFVPTDEAMEEYFIRGGGRTLLGRYVKDQASVSDPARLRENLCQIPLNIVAELLNNLMKDSFFESVPSKYLTIYNDAQDQMFSPSMYPNMQAYLGLFEGHTPIIANNGVVYLMNSVVAPAAYAAVSAPVLFSEDSRIVNSVVTADDNYRDGTQYGSAPLQQYFSTYLKAMQSHFSFFVPTDAGLSTYGYVDPASIARGLSSQYRYWRFTYSPRSNAADATDGTLPIAAQAYVYDIKKGQDPRESADGGDRSSGTNYRSPNTDVVSGNSTGLAGCANIKRRLLAELIDQHIVVHESSDGMKAARKEGRKYFLSRSGAPVYLKTEGNDADNGTGMVVDGGWQLQLADDQYEGNEHDCTVLYGYDQGSDDAVYGNGMTYFLDRPMQPSMRSVYNVMRNTPEFSEFFELCNGYDETLIDRAGFTEGLTTDADINAVRNRFRIFRPGANDFFTPNGEELVRFFSNYQYTVYVPTNAAMERALANGLPTWNEIAEYLEDSRVHDDMKGEYIPEECKAKAQAMLTMLTCFLRYHFQDQSFFVDNVTTPATSYQTACIDNAAGDGGNYVGLELSQEAAGNGSITLKDNAEREIHVVAPYNLLARDMEFQNNLTQTTGAKTYVKSSSYVTVHQIDDVLQFKKMQENGRYDSEWSTVAGAKAFVKRYQPTK